MTKKTDLESKIRRLKEIQDILNQGGVSLADSIKMLEEAVSIKKEVDKELKSIENKLIDLTREEVEENI